MKKKPSDDIKNLSGLEAILLQTHMTTMKHNLRLKLMKKLLSLRLATRDIFYFSRGQADMRTIKKTQDWATIEVAMTAKISDLKNVIRECYSEQETAK